MRSDGARAILEPPHTGITDIHSVSGLLNGPMVRAAVGSAIVSVVLIYDRSVSMCM